MSKFKYIADKDEIISLFESGRTYKEIANIYAKDEDSVNNAAQSIRRMIMHFKGCFKVKTKLQRQHETVRALLAAGKTPIEISKILSLKYPTVSGYIRVNFPEYTFLPNKGNEHYFDAIDTYSKAYIVGFIAADGCIVRNSFGKNSSLSITVKYEDKDILEFIKQEIGNTHKLLEIIRPSSFDKSKTIHHCRLSFSSMPIVAALLKLGIDYRKSLTMPNIIKNIPYKFRDAFIIGYFDGDGSVTTRDGLYLNDNGALCRDYSLYVQFRGTKEFLSGICQHLNISESHIHKYGSISTLSFANKRDTARLFKCYSNLSFFYKRKYNKFLSRIHHSSYDKYR